MASPATNAATRREWREPGFFYDCDELSKTWRVVGSASGLREFCDLLRKYAADPRHARLSEHEHYGPYAYLKVMTWTAPRLDGDGISGRTQDLARLADLVEANRAATREGASFVVGPQYALSSEYVLEIEVKPDGFDPSSADLECQDGS